MPAPAVRPVGTHQAWPGWLGGLLLVLITLVAFIPAMRAGFIWDDDAYVYRTDENVIKPGDGLRRIWTTSATSQWYPLVHTTFWIEYRLWGKSSDPNNPYNGFNPTGYHVTNIVMHAISAVLLWRILLLLGVPGAWLAAAIFAIHPIQVETVAWVTERKNVMSTMFYMIAALCYLRFAIRRQGWLYPFALLAFVAALFSKTVACSLPVAILLALWLKMKGGRATVLAGLVPFFAVGLFMAQLTSWYEFHKMEPEYYDPMPITKVVKLAWTEESDIVKARSTYDLSFAQRTIIASRALLFYPQKIIAPYPLAFFYERWNEKEELDTNELINFWPVAAVGVIAVVVFGLGAMVGRGILIGFGFFVLTIFPALGFFDVYPMRYSFVADHFQYLACIGLIALIVAGLTRLFRRVGGPPIPALNGATLPGGILALALLITLGATTAVRARAYKDEETLWLDTIAKTPTAWGAHINLGTYYGNRQEYDKAAVHYQAIIDGGANWHEAYENLGNIYALRRDFTKAESLFRQALDIQPNLSGLYSKLAKVMLLQKRPDAALTVYERADRIPPEQRLWPATWPKLYQEWGDLLEKTGRVDEAKQKYAYADKLIEEIRAKQPPRPEATTQPAGATATVNLGGAQTPSERRAAYAKAADEAVARRDYPYAQTVLEAGLQEFPTSMWLLRRYIFLLAASPIESQRKPEAALQWAQKLRASLAQINRLDAEALEVVAAAYAINGKYDEATQAATDGLRVARGAQDGLVRERLRKQLELYKAQQPYRLPVAGEVTVPDPAPTTQPGATQPAAPAATQPG